MAFTWTMTKKTQVVGGDIWEEGTWNGAGVTTGTITPDTTQTPKSVRIITAEVFDQANNNVAKSLPTGLNSVKLTFTNGDTGLYRIRSQAA